MLTILFIYLVGVVATAVAIALDLAAKQPNLRPLALAVVPPAWPVVVLAVLVLGILEWPPARRLLSRKLV